MKLLLFLCFYMIIRLLSLIDWKQLFKFSVSTYRPGNIVFPKTGFYISRFLHLNKFVTLPGCKASCLGIA